MLSTLSLIVISFIGILWTFPFILLRVVGFRLNKLTNRRQVITVSRAVAPRASVLVNGTDPSGFFYGWLYFGYIHETESQNGGKSTEVYLVCRDARYKSLTTTDRPAGKSNTIKLWERTGNKFRVNYNPREVDIGERETRPGQLAVIDSIKDVFAKRQHAVAFVYGQPGTGKSCMAMLLAKGLGASLCNTFNPTMPSNDLGELYAKVSPTKAAPLIVLLDEANLLIKRVHKQTAEISKFSFTQTADKNGWNGFLDSIDNGWYPWLIVVMTSNKSPEYIEKKYGDASYLRPGRVDLRIELR